MSTNLTEHDRKLDALQRLLAENGQFTYMVLNASNFSANVRALIVSLAVTLDGQCFRCFLDQFYALKNMLPAADQVAAPQNFITICIALKAINDICNNSLITSATAENKSQQAALTKYIGANKETEYWQIRAQAIAFASIASLKAATPSLPEKIDASELLDLVTEDKCDCDWRDKQEFRLTTSQRLEQEPEFHIDDRVDAQITNYTKQLVSIIHEDIHRFLGNINLTDGMRIYLLEKAANTSGKKFRELIDHAYNLSPDDNTVAWQALKQINDLCFNNVLFIAEFEFGRHEQLALEYYVDGINTTSAPTKVATEDKLLITNRRYVVNTVTTIVEQFEPKVLHQEMLQVSKLFSIKLPDPTWRCKADFSLTLLQILESPLLWQSLASKNLQKLELIRNEVLLAAQQEYFAAAKLAISKEFVAHGVSQSTTDVVAQLVRDATIIKSAWQAAMHARLARHHSIYVVVVVIAEILILQNSIYNPAKALLAAYSLVNYALQK